MAYTDDKKPSGLDTQSTLADADVIIHGDTDDSSRVKAITWSNLKTQIQSLIEGLSSYFDVTSDTSDDITEGSTNYFLTSAEKTVIGNTSGTNTGDQDLSSYQQKPAEGAFVDGDKTKLDAIESGADVTDAANVTAAGALMDSEVTNLSDVKSFDPADYATAAQGTTADSALQPGDVKNSIEVDSGDLQLDGDEASPGNNKVYGTDGSGNKGWKDDPAGGGGSVDTSGTPVANDFARFTDADTIEGRSYSEVRSDLSLVPGTDVQAVLSEGAFVDGDKTKLDGIEAGADVTDTANVTAAGALMDSELTSITDVKELDQSVVSGAAPNFVTTNMTEGTDKNFVTDAEATVIGNTSGTNTGDEASASTTVAGIVELATTAEVDTGTDTERSVTPDALAGSYAGTKSVVVQVFADDTDVTTGDGAAVLFLPGSVDGMNLVSAHANVDTAGTTGTTDIQIHNETDSVDMLSTVITIDSGETKSRTAATPPVINTSNDDVAAGDKLRIDVDATATTEALGLWVELEFRLP